MTRPWINLTKSKKLVRELKNTQKNKKEDDKYQKKQIEEKLNTDKNEDWYCYACRNIKVLDM